MPVSQIGRYMLLRRRLVGSVLLWLSVAAFAICLNCVAFEYNEYHNGSPEGASIAGPLGFAALFFGWSYLFDLKNLVAGIVWLANPTLLIAWIAVVCGSRHGARVFSGLSLALALSFLVAPPPFEVTSIDTGYWLWLVSTACAFVGALMMPPKQKTG